MLSYIRKKSKIPVTTKSATKKQQTNEEHLEKILDKFSYKPRVARLFRLWNEQTFNQRLRKTVRADVLFKYKLSLRAFKGWSNVCRDFQVLATVCNDKERVQTSKQERAVLQKWRLAMKSRQTNRKMNECMHRFIKFKLKVVGKQFFDKLALVQQLKVALIMRNKALKKTFFIQMLNSMNQINQTRFNCQLATNHYNNTLVIKAFESLSMFHQSILDKQTSLKYILKRRNRQILMKFNQDWLKRLGNFNRNHSVAQGLLFKQSKRFFQLWKGKLLKNETCRNQLESATLKYNSLLLKRSFKLFKSFGSGLKRSLSLYNKHKIAEYFMKYKLKSENRMNLRKEYSLKPILDRLLCLKKRQVAKTLFFHLKLKLKRQNLQKKLGKLFKRGSLERCFNALLLNSLESRHLRELNSKSLLFTSQKTLEKSLLKWRQLRFAHFSNKQLNQKSKTINELFLKKRVIVKFLKMESENMDSAAFFAKSTQIYRYNRLKMLLNWRELVEKQSILSLTERHVAKSMQFMRVVSCFDFWKNKIVLFKREYRVGKTVQFNLINFSLVKWRQLLRNHSRKQLLSAKVYAKSLLKNSFAILKQRIEKKTDELHNFQAAQKLHEHVTQKIAFSNWLLKYRKRYDNKQLLQNTIHRLLKRKSRRIKKATFHQLLKKYSFSQKLYQMTSFSSEFEYLMFTFKAFKLWQIKFKRQQELKLVLENVVNYLQIKKRQSTLKHWYFLRPPILDKSQWLILWERKNVLPLMHWRDSVLQRALNGWKLVVSKQKWLNSKVEALQSTASRLRLENTLADLLSNLEFPRSNQQFLMKKYTLKWKLFMGQEWLDRLRKPVLSVVEPALNLQQKPRIPNFMLEKLEIIDENVVFRPNKQ